MCGKGIRPAVLLFSLALFAANACAAPGADGASSRPNIIVILGDNIGYGEVSCYGDSRMVPTPRIDRLASEGLRLTNFNVEAWCAPSRSALLTGRYGIRSGTSQLPDSISGMTPWEVTIAELLSKQGYATALYGKWHLGDRPGRYPTDQGFDEWWGIARSWNDALITAAPNFIPKGDNVPFILEGKRGQPVKEGEILDMDTGQYMDRMIADKSIAYIQRNAAAKKPFFLYIPVAAVHLPVFVDPDFDGKSGAGLIGDAMMAIDHQVGRIVDAVDAAGIKDNTILIFTSDDGPEAQDPYRGTAGPWSGYYNTAMEGSLRVPFVMRWPGHIPAGRVSNEIVHVTDLFTTLVRAGGAPIPTDRIVDGVDEMDFFTGKQEKSNRDSFPIYLFGDLVAYKWGDWKLHLFWKPTPDASGQIVRKLFNLRSDPKEEYDVFWQHNDIAQQIDQEITAFEASLVKEPPVPPRAPDTYRPGAKKK